MTQPEFFDMLAYTNRWADFELPPSTVAEFMAVLRSFRSFNFDEDVARVGPNRDSGYVVPTAAIRQGGTAVCIGVGSNDAIEFDLELAKLGMNVFQFDHIVKNYVPPHNFIRFYPVGVGWRMSDRVSTLDQLLSSFVQGGGGVDIVKIDIEGDEWGVFDAVSSDLLSSVSTIVGEFHWLRHCRYAPIAKLVARVMEKISRTHVVVRLHPNNIKAPFTHHGIEFPNVLEVTFVNRNLMNGYKPRLGPVTDEFDRPSDPSRPEYQMINPWNL